MSAVEPPASFVVEPCDLCGLPGLITYRPPATALRFCAVCCAYILSKSDAEQIELANEIWLAKCADPATMARA